MERWLSSVAAGRRLGSGVWLASAGTLLVISVHLGDPVWAMVAMGLASFSNDLAMPPAWGACMDAGGNYAGSLSASMNMAGNVAGWLAPSMVALILTQTNDNWPLTFYVSAAVYFVGAVSWIFIDPVTRLDRAAHRRGTPPGKDPASC